MSHGLHYRQQLDVLTNEILSKSSVTIQKMEETIRLTHSFRSSTSLISQMDLQIDHLNTNLQQYQSILTQLNSLLIRSEYFEVQLKILENEEFDHDNDHYCSKDWRDTDLNWRTTEATLENLFLEFRFLSKKFENLSLPGFGSRSPFQSLTNIKTPIIIKTPCSSTNPAYKESDFSSPLHSKASIPFDQRSMFSLKTDQKSIISTRSYTKRSPPLSRTSFNYLKEEDELNVEKHQKQTLTVGKPETSSKTLQNKFDEFNLKPIVCSSKSITTKRRISTEIKSLNLLAIKSNGQLPTPDTTINETTLLSTSPSTCILESFEEDNTEDESADFDSFDCATKEFVISPFKKAKRSHSRSYSLPPSINLENEIEESHKLNKVNLRHFISHDTGLKSKLHHVYKYIESDEEDVKESQFVNSPVESAIASFPFNKNEVDDIEMEENTPILKEEQEEVETKANITDIYSSKPVVMEDQKQGQEEDDVLKEDKYQLPIFEHRLNRSNSCDSIFSTIQARNHAPPKRNNQEQTMSWMRKFSTQPSIVKETEVSAIYTTSSSNPINSSKALHNLVSSSNREEYTSLNNLIPPTTTWQSLWMSKNQAASKPSLESQAITITPTTVVTTSSVIKESTNLQQYSKQWVSLLSKFRPDNILQPQNVVTSEVGKPIKPIAIKKLESSTVSRLQYPHSSERLKGHASTITIGPNGSKFVNHGESSSLAQSLVLSSRVSHSALKAALCEDIMG